LDLPDVLKQFAGLPDLPERERPVDEDLLRRKLVATVVGRYTLSHFFVPMLRALDEALEARVDESPELKTAQRFVASNLGEEIGDQLMSEHATVSHAEDRKALVVGMGEDGKRYDDRLKAMGSDLENLDNVPPIERVVLTHFNTQIKADPLTGVAALATYEGWVPMGYRALLKGVEYLFPHLVMDVPQGEIDPLWHFRNHIDHDEHHTQQMIIGLCAAVRTQADVDRITEVVKNTREVLGQYWDTKGQEVEAIAA
jgi:hypothetical protein